MNWSNSVRYFRDEVGGGGMRVVVAMRMVVCRRVRCTGAMTVIGAFRDRSLLKPRHEFLEVRHALIRCRHGSRPLVDYEWKKNTARVSIATKLKIVSAYV